MKTIKLRKTQNCDDLIGKDVIVHKNYLFIDEDVEVYLEIKSMQYNIFEVLQDHQYGNL